MSHSFKFASVPAWLKQRLSRSQSSLLFRPKVHCKSLFQYLLLLPYIQRSAAFVILSTQNLQDQFIHPLYPFYFKQCIQSSDIVCTAVTIAPPKMKRVTAEAGEIYQKSIGGSDIIQCLQRTNGGVATGNDVVHRIRSEEAQMAMQRNRGQMDDLIGKEAQTSTMACRRKTQVTVSRCQYSLCGFVMKHMNLRHQSPLNS